MDDKFEEISISEIINILIKRKKLIAGITAVFLILGLINSFVLTKQKYQSELSLEVNNMDTSLAQPVGDKGTVGNVYNVLEGISRTNDMDFEDYLDEITSDEVLEETIKDLKLKDTYTVDSLRSNLSVKSDPELRSINLRIVSKDPDMGADIVNKLGENFAEHITRISQENALQTLEIIEKQMEIEKEKYAEGLEEYEEATKGKKSAHELELEIEGAYEQLTDYKLSLNDLQIKEEAVKSALEKSKNTSGSQGMILRPSGSNGYVYLDSSEKALEVDLAETKARIESTKDTVESLQEETQALQIEYQNVEFAESVIRQKVDLTKQSYEVFSQKYQELKMATSIDVGGISINTLSEATDTPKAVGTRKSIKVIMFFILGLMTGLITSFVVEYIERRKAKEKTNK